MQLKARKKSRNVIRMIKALTSHVDHDLSLRRPGLVVVLKKNANKNIFLSYTPMPYLRPAGELGAQVPLC